MLVSDFSNVYVLHVASANRHVDVLSLCFPRTSQFSEFIDLVVARFIARTTILTTGCCVLLIFQKKVTI